MNIPKETDYLSLLGFKTRRQDISASVPFNVGVDLRNIRRGNKTFSNLLKERIPERKSFFYDQDITQKDLADAYINDEEQTLKREQQLKFMVDQYLTLGLDVQDIINSLQVNKATPEGKNTIQPLVNILNNRHDAYDITKTDIANFNKFLSKRKNIDVNEMLDNIDELHLKFNRTKINKDK